MGKALAVLAVIGILAILGALVAAFSLTGVGTRVCALHQPGCDFTDHVLTVSPSGTLCPTWNVQFAQYNPNGQPTDTYAIQEGRDDIVATLRKASDENLPVHVWYAGEQYVIYNRCHADHPLVIYEAQIEGVPG